MNGEDNRKPLREYIEADEGVYDLNCPMAIELKFVTSSKLSEMEVLREVIKRVREDLLKRFDKEGFPAFVLDGEIRPMTQDELLACIPRKMHLRSGDGWLCRTARVGAKHITNDRTKVTCKLCLGQMAQAGEAK
jgi:hypothetical protein